MTVETDVPTSGYPPEQINGFKNGVRSEAYFDPGHAVVQGEQLGGGRDESAQVD